MLRLRTVVPLLLSSLAISSLAVPASGDSSTSYCAAAPGSPRCEAELARAFAAERNAEINASIAAVKHAREFAQARNAEIDASIAAVAAERERSFAAARNAEIDASIAAVKRAREFANARNAEINASIAAVNAERANQFAAAQNALINASIAAVDAERERAFAAARNAEINASIAAVNAARASELALSLTHCKSAESTTPRCQAERTQEFAAARNAEANGSIAAVRAERDRALAAQQNALSTASIARVRAAAMSREYAMSTSHCSGNEATPRCEAERARELALSQTHCKTEDSTTPRCEAERTREFAAARNAEINASLAAVRVERARSFAAARNAEINAALAAYESRRSIRPMAAPTETGAIGIPETPARAPLPTLHQTTSQTEACRAAGDLMPPLQYSGAGTEVENSMKPGLDRLAAIARSCPAVRMEIHGHYDASGSAIANQRLSEVRAQGAVAYLVAAGVQANRLAAIGHGEAAPLVPNTTAANRVKNQRLEVTINDPATQAAASRVMWDLAELLDPTYVPPMARLSP